MEWDDDRWEARDGLVEEAQVNHLYHRKRERMFSLLDRWSKVLALIAGSAAATAYLEGEDAKAAAGLVVAVVTLIALVFDWSDRARLHSELAAEYAHIESGIEGVGVMGWEQLDAVKARLVSIRAKEPPELAALLLSCQNELYIAHGQEDMVIDIGWRRWLMHLVSLPVPNVNKSAAHEEAAGSPSA